MLQAPHACDQAGDQRVGDEEVLSPHRVHADSAAVLAQRLQAHGVLVVQGVTSRRDVLALARQIMHIEPHPDSDPDGLTTIHDTRRHGGRPGFAGFTNQDLPPHTERSGTVVPPRLMLMVCQTPAHRGGECLLTDGRAVHAELMRTRPDAVAALAQPRTAFFGAAGGHATQIFTTHPGGLVSIRLRTDELARFSPLAQPHLPALREALLAHQVRLRLRSGQGYVIDNARWLHARGAFTGHRVFWRALGRSRFPLAPGFVPAIASQASYDTEGEGPARWPGEEPHGHATTAWSAPIDQARLHH
jgi:hypothetical protein